jgi:transposase-like protein
MLLLASSVCGLFKWRQFEPEVILLAVGWYLRFSLSYRDVEELLAERGLHADHVTVWRWVQRYAPEMERLVSRLVFRVHALSWHQLLSPAKWMGHEEEEN